MKSEKGHFDVVAAHAEKSSMGINADRHLDYSQTKFSERRSIFGILPVRKVFAYIVVVGILLVMYGCPFDPHECFYKYPINITNLKDTIKTTDTLWVENDFDASFCSETVVFKNEHDVIIPTPMKLIKDSLVFYDSHIVIDAEGKVAHRIKMRQQNGRYKLKYGIVFPDTGIYVFEGARSSALYENHTEVYLDGYFDTPNNNLHLLPEKLQKYYANYSGYTTPYKYYYYFIAVVE